MNASSRKTSLHTPHSWQPPPDSAQCDWPVVHLLPLFYLRGQVQDILLLHITDSKSTAGFYLIFFSLRNLFFFFFFLGSYPQHMEVPRLDVQSELQLPPCTTATATPDLSWICNLRHSSQQCRILNPLRGTRDPHGYWLGSLQLSHSETSPFIF